MDMHDFQGTIRQNGMTLVEIMVALTIGLLITLAITTLFISMRQSYLQNDAIAKMQENARFALELITQDLRHAGFFGDIADPADIDITRAPATAVDNCGGGINNFASASVLLNYGRQVTNPDGIAFYDNCVTTAEIAAAGSSILLVKRSVTTPPASIQTGFVYTYANGSQAQLYSPANPHSLSGGADWEYQTHLYYIDAERTLQRKYLRYSSSSQPTLVSEPLADGIEAFHIEFGIDLDRNGTPELFYTPADGAASDATLDNAVSATVYILARTQDRVSGMPGGKTYQLGRLAMGPYGDNIYRRVYAATTALKNIRHQVMLRQGVGP
jgi:type IV pilus assembly protein PilW